MVGRVRISSAISHFDMFLCTGAARPCTYHCLQNAYELYLLLNVVVRRLLHIIYNVCVFFFVLTGVHIISTNDSHTECESCDVISVPYMYNTWTGLGVKFIYIRLNMRRKTGEKIYHCYSVLLRATGTYFPREFSTGKCDYHRRDKWFGCFLFLTQLLPDVMCVDGMRHMRNTVRKYSSFLSLFFFSSCSRFLSLPLFRFVCYMHYIFLHVPESK